jgi:phytoene dehydrogenase-like protein
MQYDYDAVIIGSGPNGLCAAAGLAKAGHSVLLVEAHDTLGGGLRSAELTRPGFIHDVCSAVHPLGVLSPFMRSLPLQAHGLDWVHPPLSAAHPLPDGRAVVLERSIDATAAQLGVDARSYRRLFEPFLRAPGNLLADLLAPLGIPRHPLAFARFGLYGMRSALGLAQGMFRGEEARALFAGCAAHAILPFDKWFTAAVGMMFLVSGHATDWPMARGGSASIARALASYLRSLGGEIRTGQPVSTLSELPRARAYLFDLAPRLRAIAGACCATTMALRCSSSTMRCRGRSRGSHPNARAPRPCTWVAACKRSRARNTRHGTARSPSSRS